MKIEVHSPNVRRREMDAVLTQLVEEKLGPGEQSQRLIQIAKDHLNFEAAIALRSPVMALALALRVFKPAESEQGEKNAVLISALSPRYYGQVIAEAGMHPVICDVAPGSAYLSAGTLQAAIEENAGNMAIRCVLVHETLGFLPDMPALAELGIPIIEDCSAAYGSMLGENKAGSFGALSILGLEERDMLTAGGGALLFTADKRNAAVLRNYAALPPEYGLPDMNAAMAIVQLRETGRNAEKLGSISQMYTDATLRGGRHKLLVRPDNVEYNNYAFPLALETGMKDVAAYARKKEIVIENAFEHTLAGAGLVQNETCPNAASLCLRTALFPLYPRLGQESAQKVARLIQTLP